MSTDSARPFDRVLSAARVSSRAALIALATRLHFYVGLFIGPFIFIAALTGTLYVLTPQIETRVYAAELFNDSVGGMRPLSEQIAAARAHLAQQSPGGEAGAETGLAALRPATGPGTNTRVMFSRPGLAPGEHLAVFIDPVTLAPHGQLAVYGTSGTMPFRNTIDYLHRNLMLGELGRNYSELAASWLGVTVLVGLALWAAGGPRNQAHAASRSPRLRTRRWHGLLGLVLALGLLFFSATGLTWSNWAGGRIDTLRAALNWVTPPLNTRLEAQAASPMGDPHADHGDHAGHAQHSHSGHQSGEALAAMPSSADLDARFDGVLGAARQAGIDSPYVEIRAAPTADRAWTVREYDRSWPTQVDSVAVDPRNMEVISRSDFERFPLVAKLIRWGIDMHMGILFGWPNQLLLAALGIGLCFMIGLGYRMWWLRRPAAGPAMATLAQAWLALPVAHRTGVVVLALLVGWSLPVLGASLIVLLGIDVLRWRVVRARQPA